MRNIWWGDDDEDDIIYTPVNDEGDQPDPDPTQDPTGGYGE